MNKTKNAFTLVELIVVITILAVLATVAFISFVGYTQSARDGARISDLRTVEKALIFYQTQNNRFPEPSDAQNITIADGWTINLWKQWVIWKSVITTLRSISQIPLDPNTQEYIKYSTTLNNQEYQILGYLEDNHQSNIISESYARTDFPKVSGSYNKHFVVWSNSKYYATPSLFSSGSDVSSLSRFDINTKTVDFQVTNLQNLWWEDITLENIWDNFTDFWKALQDTYSGSVVEDQYDYLLNIENNQWLNDFAQIITGNKDGNISQFWWSSSGVWCVFDTSNFWSCDFQ